MAEYCISEMIQDIVSFLKYSTPRQSQNTGSKLCTLRNPLAFHTLLKWPSLNFAKASRVIPWQWKK